MRLPSSYVRWDGCILAMKPLMNLIVGASVDAVFGPVILFGQGGTAVEVVKDQALALLGQKVYRGGVQGTGVPACASCHGAQGKGIPAQFPRLAGQHTDYIYAELNKFRTGERANDGAKMMRTIAAKMTDADMKAVATYIQGLR